MSLNISAHHYKELKAQMLDAFPDLAEDEDALADTLEGEHSFPDQLADIVRSALEDEAKAEGMKDFLGKLRDRQAWLKQRAAKKKKIVLYFMEEVGLKRLDPPDFTCTRRVTQPGVQVINEDDIPDDYWRIKREPDLSKIRQFLKDGTAIPGCTLKNASETLTIKV